MNKENVNNMEVKKTDNRFKDRIKSLRKEVGLTQEELGKAMGFSKVAACHWESGKRFPEEPTLVKLANYFDVSLDYLLGRTNNKNGKIYEDTVDGKHVKVEYNIKGYPNDMDHAEVLRILEKVKRAKDLGIDIMNIK